MEPTLNIIYNSSELFLDPLVARAKGEQLSSDYCFAEPFPHIVIDNFLPEECVNDLLNDFPKNLFHDDIHHETGYGGHHKRQINPNSCDRSIREKFNFFNSASVLQFLEGLTCINGLIGDPYYSGGGFHEISSGGKLGIHADFRINEKLSLNRRLNLLIYLNKEWKDSYGGELELWDPLMTKAVRKVSPIFNRCVIFSTDATSFHGHPEPLNIPENVKRKSIALYYYTGSKKIYEEVPADGTVYKARPGDGAGVRRQVLRFNLDNKLKDWTPPIVLRAIKKIRKKIA